MDSANIITTADKIYGKKEITDSNAELASSIPEICPTCVWSNIPENTIAKEVKRHNIPVNNVSRRATKPCETGSLVLTVA